MKSQCSYCGISDACKSEEKCLRVNQEPKHYWNYRAIIGKRGQLDTLGLHEVYYENGRPTSWIAEPVFIVEIVDGLEAAREELLAELRHMVEGAEKEPLREKEIA